ncbi:MAG: hypothetical protein R2795_03195 [Saprospiraceae bacterium]
MQNDWWWHLFSTTRVIGLPLHGLHIAKIGCRSLGKPIFFALLSVTKENQIL